MPDLKDIEGATADATPVEKHLKLDAEHLSPLLAARIAQVTATIQANDANRRKARASALGAAGATDAAKAQADLTTACTAKSVARADYSNAMVLAKAAHNALESDYAEELLDLGRGVLILREQAEAQVRGLPPVERKRIQIPDKDCDLYAASYALSCAAGDEAADLARQVEDYKAAHPALFTGPGEPPPVDPDYEALKAALDVKVAAVQAEQARQGAIVQKALGSEQVTYYMAVNIATGEIVLGDRPEDKE